MTVDLASRTAADLASVVREHLADALISMSITAGTHAIPRNQMQDVLSCLLESFDGIEGALLTAIQVDAALACMDMNALRDALGDADA